MSSARCLNWSRPPPGRHPSTSTTTAAAAAAAAVLRKQVSCIEHSSGDSQCGSLSSSALSGSTTAGGHRPSTVNTLSTALAVQQHQQQQPPPPADGCDHFCQFLVTGAIIHTNRFQNYHTYNQAHRGASGSGSVTPLGYHHQQHPSLPQRRRPSSASASGGSGGSGIVVSTDPAPGPDPTRTRLGRRAILCKQLSLDQSILVAATAASSIASGMAAVANAAAGDGQPDAGSSIAERGWGFGRKQASRIGPGAGMKCEMEPGCKKGPKAGKDSRINIKIFLGQTVQQDSSDTGISDTEAPTPATTTTTTTSTATAAASLQKSDSTPAMSSTSSTTMTMPTEPYSTFTTGSGSKGIKAAIQASSTSSGSQSSNSGGNTGAVGSGTTTGTTSGRSSSLAQRRAQFQANRQNSEAHDRRHPPLVRAMSAPIRPADPDTSKFLQSKKKPRRRKVLREKDEYNICEEDEYSDEGGNILCSSGSSSSCNGTGGGALSTNGAGTVKGSASIGNGGLPLRSRSVLGGACDIETLVSLLSSGGSDSEKEQEQQNSTQNTVPPNGPASGHGAGSGVASPASFRQPFTSAHLKGRAPMLKKTGKSVSFQESDLKPPVANAGLNRDYRKPTFQPTVANRVRRAVHTLNAFQLKDREKSDEKEPNEEKWASDWLTREKDPGQSPQDSSPSAEHPTKQGAAGAGGGKTTETTGKSSSAAIAGTNGDLLQSPKEQECYRLYLKMSKKGLAVSYDTILRGMLTPTELRVLQKKKSRCQRADDGDGAKDENLIGSEDDMLSPGENGPLSPIAITEPSLKEHELSLPLPCQTATSAGGLGILTIPEEPSVIEHEITASGDSDVS